MYAPVRGAPYAFSLRELPSQQLDSDQVLRPCAPEPGGRGAVGPLDSSAHERRPRDRPSERSRGEACVHRAPCATSASFKVSSLVAES